MKLFKSILAAFLFFVLFSFHANSQICTRMVDTFKPGGYEINGTAMLKDSGGVLMLIFLEDFSTDSGPDLVVYLADSNKSPTAPDNDSYEIDTLESPSGKQSYVLPSNIGLGDYDNVLIYCKEFDAFWGGGTLGDSVCRAVKINQLNNKDLTVRYHPNPFQDQLYIEFETPSKGEVNLTIINSAGILYHKEKMEHNEMMFNTQNYPAGLYYLNVITNSNVYTYPILKE